MPIKIGTALQIVSLGKIVFDRPGFHSERYLYPDGFVSKKLFPSLEDPTEKVWWRSLIIDRGGKGPVFRVEMKGKPEIAFEGLAPSNPWLMVIKAVEDKKREMGLPANRSLTISGPESFGLSAPIVIHLMQAMENAGKCSRFVRRDSKVESESENAISDEEEVRPKKAKQKKATVREMTKTELVLHFPDIYRNGLPDLVIDANWLLQRDALDVAVPFVKRPLLAAIKRMAERLEMVK
jgi:chromodomain-helicase-DNA-binding protein 7